MGNFNPLNPTKYRGTDKYITFFVTRNRAPTGADYRQPETGTLYSVGTIWQVGKNPSTGVEGDEWILSKIVANVGYWVKFVSGDTPSGPALKFQVDAATAPGINPVMPDSNGLTTLTGAVASAQGIPLRTHTIALNEYLIESQYSSAIASTDTTMVGLCAFDTSQFIVDENGFVQFNGDAFTDLHWPRFIVGDLDNGANYATLGAAYAAASAGDVIGIQDNLVLTENLTINKKIFIMGLSPPGFSGSSQTSSKIKGKFTINSSFIASNLTFETNADNSFLLGAGGAVLCSSCYFNGVDANTVMGSSSSSSFIAISCQGAWAPTFTLGTFLNTAVMMYNTICGSSGTLTPTTTTTAFYLRDSIFFIPLAASLGGGLQILRCTLGTLFSPYIDQTWITTSGTGTSIVEHCQIYSGTQPCISVGAGTAVIAANNVVNSSNTNVFTGLGTISTGGNVCTGSSSGNNVSTINMFTVI